MTIVMIGNNTVFIAIYSFCRDDWTPQISANVFSYLFGVALIWLCIDIKSISTVFVDITFVFLNEGPIFSSISFKRAVLKAFLRYVFLHAKQFCFQHRLQSPSSECEGSTEDFFQMYEGHKSFQE